jgi:PTH1 family peptidyl-tRNA hydrolase
MIELTAFLGNPGREYSRNRHNAGFLLAEKLSFSDTLSWQMKFKGLYACIDRMRLTGNLTGRLHFIKPGTYVNLSGRSVLEAASFFKIKTDAIMVVHDELELPLGTLSLKFGGGLGGHNGLRSMKACFGSADFWRLRIGIGRPESGEGIADWVLTNFREEELETLDRVLETGAELLFKALSGDPQDLLPEWAKKKVENETKLHEL